METKTMGREIPKTFFDEDCNYYIISYNRGDIATIPASQVQFIYTDETGNGEIYVKNDNGEDRIGFESIIEIEVNPEKKGKRFFPENW